MGGQGIIAPVVCMRDITKRFGTLLANDRVTLELQPGEILGLLGENGAGKTTLMRILFGLLQPDKGQIFIDGKGVRIPNPRAANELGIGMVHQHFSLALSLSVGENIVLGREPTRLGLLDKSRIDRETIGLCKRTGLEVDPRATVESLSVAYQQRVEILKILYRDVRILILDEPTAVLAPQSVDDLFGVIRRLTQSGMSVIFISHKLSEVMSLADRAMVLRRGSVVGNVPVASTTESELSRLMIGHKVAATAYKSSKTTDEPLILELNKVSVEDQRGLVMLEQVSFHVHRGEVLGVAGVEGNGQRELEGVVIGVARAKSGSIRFMGEDITRTSPRRRLERGIWFIPPDRHDQGLLLDSPLTENLVLGAHWRAPASRGLWLQPASILGLAKQLIGRFDLRAKSPLVLARQLSGGNQQKLIVARVLGHDPVLLLASQPTRGIDVASIQFVHREILELRAKAAVLIISYDLDELLKLCDRLLVLYRGRVVAQFKRPEFDKEQIGLCMLRGTAAR